MLTCCCGRDPTILSALRLVDPYTYELPNQLIKPEQNHMSCYHNDQPLTGDESNPDQLNREQFAVHLTEILTLNPKDDCLTVSLEGEWGYGKTSVVNLVKKSAAQQDHKPIIIEYNPWLAGKAEALIQDFLVQFSSQLNIPDRPKEGLQVAKELLAYSNLFNAMKFIPGVEPWASTVQGVFKVVGSATNKISKLKELDVIGRKKKVKDILSSLNQSIIVIIDDIDRLTSDEAFQVVRLVKAVADFPGASFLLCFDPDYLIGALEKHGIKKADQYVDKVVQLRVPLPLITHRDMQQLANTELANLSDKTLTDYFEEDRERLGYLYHQHAKYLIRTPRELKRIFNNLRLVLVHTEGEVCFSDLYCLSVIAIKAHHIYQTLKDSPEIFIGRSFDTNYPIDKAEEVVEKNKDELEELLSKCSTRDKKHIHSLIKELFPLVDGGGWYSGTRGDHDQMGRVASEKRLYTALHYQVPTGFAADADILKFIDGSINREQYLKEAINKDFVERFFELIQHNIEKIDDSEITGILNSIYSVFLYSEYIASFQNAKLGFFGFDPLRNIYWITLKLLEKTEEKFSIIEGLVQDPKNLPITADILRRLMVQNGDLKSDNPSDGENKWLEGSQYQKIKESWSQLAIVELGKDHVLNSVHATHFYYTLYNSSKAELKKLLGEWLDQEGGTENIAKLLSRTGGTDSTNGPSAHVKEDSVSELLDFKKLKMIAETELSSGRDLPIKIEAVYLSITTGGKYYLRDAQKREDF